MSRFFYDFPHEVHVLRLQIRRSEILPETFLKSLPILPKQCRFLDQADPSSTKSSSVLAETSSIPASSPVLPAEWSAIVYALLRVSEGYPLSRTIVSSRCAAVSEFPWRKAPRRIFLFDGEGEFTGLVLLRRLGPSCFVPFTFYNCGN